MPRPRALDATASFTTSNSPGSVGTTPHVPMTLSSSSATKTWPPAATIRPSGSVRWGSSAGSSSSLATSHSRFNASNAATCSEWSVVIVTRPDSSGTSPTELRIQFWNLAQRAIRRWKWLPEREGQRRGTMHLEVLETFQRFNDRGNVAGGNPPEDQDGTLDGLEPLLPVAQALDVITAVHELLERLERIPDRHVDGHPVVGEWPDRDRVAVFGLQSPDEARTAVGERIDRIELRPEPVHDRIVDGRAKSPDIRLRQLKTAHCLSHFPFGVTCRLSGVDRPGSDCHPDPRR